MKRAAAKRAGIPLWQKSFHDHVIRGEADYRRIWSYIDANPRKWREDCYMYDLTGRPAACSPVRRRKDFPNTSGVSRAWNKRYGL